MPRGHIEHSWQLSSIAQTLIGAVQICGGLTFGFSERQVAALKNKRNSNASNLC